VETVAAVFRDLVAVILRLTMDLPCSIRGKGYWRMNVSFLSDASFQQTMKENWEQMTDTYEIRSVFGNQRLVG